MRSPKIAYEGVTFDNIRAALCAAYFLTPEMLEVADKIANGEIVSTEKKKELEALWREALEYVLPMQHNFENPIKPGSQDTWIQFWVDEDDRQTQDYNISNRNETLKVARITVRYLGVRAETWAKVFHHLIKRKNVPRYFFEYCNAQMLDYISPIVPINVDYFGANTTIAHDLSFSLVYAEYMKFDWKPLELISLAPGETMRGPAKEGKSEL
jgi:hypothetical protein